MRIPPTSVVNRVGDCGLCGLRLTAAQLLWVTNFVCFLFHTTMVVVTFYFAWHNKNMSKYGDDDPYHIKIYRVSARWDNSTADGYEFAIEDNGIGFNLAWGTIFFFGISAVFHFVACIVGLFESTWLSYWRQIDDAFCWWRWLEYSASCSLMGILLSITLGIREEYTLTCFFVLLALTQSFGFLTELYSRPVLTRDATSYQWPVGRRGFTEAPDYTKDPNALHLISQTYWEGDRVLRDETGAPTGSSTDLLHAQRTSNFVRRLVPYFLGFLPFMTYIVINVFHLEYQSARLYDETDGEMKIPGWVRAMLYGTFALFSSFSFVLPLYQYLPPSYYWGAELTYAVLSLAAKGFLGLVILLNVVMEEQRAESLLGAGGLEKA
jgi:hypothetical protein